MSTQPLSPYKLVILRIMGVIYLLLGVAASAYLVYLWIIGDQRLLAISVAVVIGMLSAIAGIGLIRLNNGGRILAGLVAVGGSIYLAVYMVRQLIANDYSQLLYYGIGVSGMLVVGLVILSGWASRAIHVYHLNRH